MSSKESPSHFVGIGASAGGLEALQSLFRGLASDIGAAYIIVQHLSPDYESMMPELLGKHTEMHIITVTDGVEVMANTIYLLPPKKNLIVAEGKLLLTDTIPEQGINLPIDIFFRSLAQDQLHKTIGIILSGTGSDGSRGIKALKEVGGLILVQDPDEAKFDGMPNSAINTGLVDLISSSDSMGEKLQNYIKHPVIGGNTESLRAVLAGNESAMEEIFSLLKMKSEIDFAKYKASTVARRIERRMVVNQINSLSDYLTLLFKNQEEVRILSRELLIGVTRFFRDEEAFETLKKTVIPDIVSRVPSNETIRVWVAACSTGEEAYSLAILFLEEIGFQGKSQHLKIFATDANPDSITEASVGRYTEDTLHDVPQDYRSRYFIQESNGDYRVSPQMRESVIFATHNMITDPPFSNMMLATCRNVLIYFQHSVQKKALSSLHFSLRQNGYLLLGLSENIGDYSIYFDTINERFKIYKKNTDLRIPLGSSAIINRETHRTHNVAPIGRALKYYTGYSANSAISQANESLIKQYAPPCILISDEHEAVHVYGDVSAYIRRLPPGRISKDIKDLVNEDLSIAVSTALHRAKSHPDEPVFYSDVVTRFNDETYSVDLCVRYIREKNVEGASGYYWLIFENKSQETHEDKKTISFDVMEQSKQRIADLELELKRSREHLQVTVEELETTNEELQSSNEELMSANEELQSTNEELQSVNEELYTVNSEYQEKIAELSQVNTDLDEILKNSNIGIIFLDDDLNIRRYTPIASRFVNLRESDLNRPIHHISLSFDYDNLLSDIDHVRKSGKSFNREITLDEGIIRLRIAKYPQHEDKHNPGIVITFTDYSEEYLMRMAMETTYSELHKTMNNILESLDRTVIDEINVLLVDDQEYELELISAELDESKQCEWKITRAASYQEAYSKLLSREFDVCFCDYNLDNHTAIDIQQKLTELEIPTPLVVISGAPLDSLDTILLANGILDIIYKQEINARSLMRAARYAIRRKQINDQINKLSDHSESPEPDTWHS